MSEFGSIPPAPEQPTTAAAVAVPPEPPKKSRTGMFFLGAFSGCLLVLFGVAFFAIAYAMSDDSTSANFDIGSNKVAVIPVEGEIVESRDTIDAIHRYADNPSVKAIVIRINSPGGAIAPSQEIYSEIRKVRKASGKPFVASLDSVAASGGYYIAVGCDQIVANPGSITGSIGVILQWMNIQELARWAKLKPETLTSGAMKDAGSPFREMTEAERAYLQRIVTQLHGQFVKAVAAGRTGKVTEQEVARIADGRIFTGEEAAALKLVDSLGNLDDAVVVAAKLAGVEGEPTKLYPRKRDNTLLELLSSSSDADAFMQRIISGRAGRFLYLW
jgi:protease-4